MSNSRTLKWWPFPPKGRVRPAASRRRQFARRNTPLRLEHLERRDLLAALPPPDLVSWYRAEGNALDFADGNNGSLMNGAIFAAGQVGQAFSFDGADDLVSVPYSANLDIQQSITLDAWVNPSASTSLPGGVVIVGRPFGYQLGILSNGHVAFGFPSGGSAAVNRAVESSSSIPLNAFTHVAATFDSATGQANIYVNGVLENTAVASGPINSMVKPLQIGGFDDPGFTGGFFQGLIDEVDVFDRALSPAEVQTIFSAGSDGKATIVVDTTGDSIDALDGVTSLREAIGQSNTTAGRDAIGFSIPRPSTSDLVSWWRAEGNTNDSAGVNQGTLQNGATFAPGRYGQAFSLDGTDDYVQFPDAANLDGMAQLTVDTWVKFNALPSGKEQFILSKAQAVGVGSNSYAFWLDGATMRLTTAVETTTGLMTLQAPDTFTDTTAFHHLALTYDGAMARFFVDGVLKSSAALSGSILDTPYPVLIGRRSGTGTDGNGDAFSGLVDEAGISNRALSDAEIQAIASGARTISPNSALPALTDAAIIDGYTQPGASPNTLASGNNAVLKVGLDGANAGSASGLLLAGGSSTVRGLAIGNFSGNGVHLASSDNVIEGNFIGTDVTGTMDRGNGGDGVAIVGDSTGNSILGNSIFASGGLGIDLGNDGVTPNDPGDTDSGPNDLQNTPVIAALSSSPTDLLVTGSLDSAPSSRYRIEFFASDSADPSGSGEGQRILGALRVTTDASGHADIDHELPPVSDGQWITATATLLATADDAPVETSEFSAAVQAHTQVTSPTIQFTSTHYDVIEGQEFAVLTVELTGRVGAFATVDFTTTDGTAGQRAIRSGLLRVEDYTTTAGTLVFRRGVTQREIQVPIRDDSIIEPDELFHVVLSNPSPGVTLGANSTADVTIHDNDPTVQFAATSSKRGESATGRGLIQVQLTPASKQTVTVAYAAVGGTATFNQDYRPNAGTLTFRPGETSKFINFTTINDTLYEGDETVIYELSSPTHAFLGDQTRHKVTIVDDDPPPPPADPGSTPATALFIDLQTVPNQSYVQNLRPSDRDVFRVHLTAGENLAIDVDPAKFGLTTQQLATSTLIVIAPDGRTPLATIGRSPEPDTGIYSDNPAYLFHATDTGDYFLRLQTTQTGVSGYRIWFHLVGGVSEHVPAPDLLNVAGSMYAWFDGQDTVGITGPTGYGFTLEGPWQQQVSSVGKSVLTSQTLTLPVGSRLTLRSPQGVDLPLIANGPIVISTNKQRWGNVFGIVSTSAINFPVSLGISPINDLLAQVFGSNIVAFGLLSGDWRISLGGKTLAVNGRNTTSTIDPLLDGVPYLRQKGPINFNAQLGQYSLDYSVIDKPVDWAFDPGDPMLYLKVDDAGPVRKPALALSVHGLLEYNPLDAPSPLIDAGVTHFYGQVYETAQIPFKIGPVPLKIVADEVFNIDADRDGHVLGGLRNAGALLDVFQGDFSEVRAVLDDIQFGANGQLFLDIKDPQLEFELGRASVVFNGLEESLWVRGQQGGANPLAGTPLAQFNSGTTVIIEGLISLSGDFLLSTTTIQDLGLTELTYAITITNHGIFAHVEGKAQFGVSIDTGIGSVSGKAIADLQADISIDIDDNGDIHLSGSVSASGKLVASGNTLFSGSISASVKSRGFRFKFPKGVGDINLNVI